MIPQIIYSIHIRFSCERKERQKRFGSHTHSLVATVAIPNIFLFTNSVVRTEYFSFSLSIYISFDLVIIHIFNILFLKRGNYKSMECEIVEIFEHTHAARTSYIYIMQKCKFRFINWNLEFFVSERAWSNETHAFYIHKLFINECIAYKKNI